MLVHRVFGNINELKYEEKINTKLIMHYTIFSKYIEKILHNYHLITKCHYSPYSAVQSQKALFCFAATSFCRALLYPLPTIF